MNCNGPRSNRHQGGLNIAPPGKLCKDFSKHKWDKIVVGEEGKKNYPIRDCKVRVQSKVKLDTFVNSALFCFTKGLVLRNTTQLGTTRLPVCSVFSTGFRSNIYTVKS